MLYIFIPLSNVWCGDRLPLNLGKLHMFTHLKGKPLLSTIASEGEE